RTIQFEQLELVGRELLLDTQSDGTVLAESRAGSDILVRVNSDDHVRDVSLKTQTNPELPSDLGTIGIVYSADPRQALSIDARQAIELLIQPKRAIIGMLLPVREQ